MERGQGGKQEKTVVVSETLERPFIELNVDVNTHLNRFVLGVMGAGTVLCCSCTTYVDAFG